MIISENKRKLISILVRYDSRKFIERIIALLDTEEEAEHVLKFVENNITASKTDIHEFIIRMKYNKK